MRLIEADQVSSVMRFDALIDALQVSFAGDYGMPQRQLHHLQPEQHHGDAFAVLPAWNEQVVGVKAFTYFPDNPSKGLPTLASKVMLFDRPTGAPLALIDGTQLTYWRTAAASALAARILARSDSEQLLLCGTGNLAPYMALAHASALPIKRVYVWGRDAVKAGKTIEVIAAQRPDLECILVDDINSVVREVDVISCATGAAEPLFSGDQVKQGCHVDLVGNHAADRRECDSWLVEHSRVFVDSRLNVLNEAGELLLPIAEGGFTEHQIEAELAELCQAAQAGQNFKRDDNDITLYKSVGSALADLAAAAFVLQQTS